MKNKKLIKELKEQIEILSIVAIPREKEAYRTYVSLANKSSMKSSKDLFIELARQEVEHERHLVKLKDELVEKVKALKLDI